MQPSVVGVSEEILEQYQLNLFEDFNLLTVYVKRITVAQKDIQLVRTLRGYT
jgi:histone H3/H4